MITIKNNTLEVEITEEGAELRSIKYCNREYLYQGDHTWKRRAPILFPWAGRLRNLEYTYDGVEYHMGQHGFARDMTFSVVEKEEDRVKMMIESNDSTLKIYPREFKYYVEYKVEGNALSSKMTVENTGEKEMTYGIGIHPGFIMEDREAMVFIESEDNDSIILDANGDIVKEERVEETLPLSFFSNNTTLIVPNAKKARMKGKDREVEINLTHFKNLVIWRSGNDPFICLEAWDNLPSKNGEEENFNTRSNTVKQEKSSTLQFESVFFFSLNQEK